jgi:hypothetical protein
MESNRPVTGTGKTPDKAEKDAAKSADPGTYEVSITGTVQKNGNPDPTPIGDYRATLTPSGP